MIDTTSLYDAVKKYYWIRELKEPDAMQALAFVTTEQGEVYDLLFQRDGDWVRNNPEDKPTWSMDKLEEELGDMIMMVVAAGIAEGVNPLSGLVSKMERKLKERGLLPLDECL